MPGTRKRQRSKRKARTGTAGMRKTAQRKQNMPARQHKKTGNRRRIKHTGESPSERQPSARRAMRKGLGITHRNPEEVQLGEDPRLRRGHRRVRKRAK